MVVVDPRGHAASQGSAVLSPARGKFGVRIRRLRIGAEFASRRFRRADPPFPGCRDLREGQIRWLPPAQSVAELGPAPPLRFGQYNRPTKRRSCERLFAFGPTLL